MAATVVTSDGERFVLEEDVAAQCGMIGDFTSGDSTEEIPLLNVSADVMRRVITYCEHHRSDTTSEQNIGDGRVLPVQVDEWDKNFMIMDQEMLFEIIIAANYLNIKPLLDLGCHTVAEMIKGRSREEK